MLAATARFVLNELGVAAPAPEESEDENAAVVAAVEAELGSDWPKQVAPRFDANKAILFDDRWASAREDLARAYYDNDPAALNGSFIGLARPSPPKPVVRQRVGERRTQGRLPEGRLRGPRTGCVQQERLPLRE